MVRYFKGYRTMILEETPLFQKWWAEAKNPIMDLNGKWIEKYGKGPDFKEFKKIYKDIKL